MIVEQNYWDNSYENYIFHRLPHDDPTKMIIETFIPNVTDERHAFEIGCFPGRFLVEIGKKGYVLNGCDQTGRVEKDLPLWLKQNNCKVGSFFKSDYKKFYNQQYDLVASFGFIEHFDNFEEVFLHHCSMVKPNGILIVQFPNFKGVFQKILHLFFDIDNLNNHVLLSMDLDIYHKYLNQDFDIVISSFYGNFDFWIDDFKKRNGLLKRILLNIFLKTKKIYRFLPNSCHWSPYAIIIARKK